MAIPAGHIITVGGLNVIDRLQDAGLQNPRVPTETIRETGNDLVVGKVLTEAAFTFQLTSWDTSCDMMALLTGKYGTIEANKGPAGADAAGTKYKWENCQFINLACPWARDTGSEGGHIASGVLVPGYYPSALSYKFGVTANAEQTVTLDGGAYYMAEAYPIEEYAVSTGLASYETSEEARVHRIGGFGSETYRHVFGVTVNGVLMQEGVDYVEEGGSKPAEASKKVKIKFTTAPTTGAIVKWCYFSDKAHELPQAVHANTTIVPAAVRGRNITILVGPVGEQMQLRGIQSFDLNATHTGTVQREMGTYDPIGYSETGIDANGTIQIEPKEEAALYAALEKLTGVARTEVFGYINEHTVPLEAKIYNPKKPSEILKSIRCTDAKLQIPGTAAKVQQVVSLPLAWESESGTFEEVKGQ